MRLTFVQSFGLLPNVESEDLTSTTPMIATMLDPRHKDLGFLVPASRISAHSMLLELAMAENVSCTSGDEATTEDDVQVQGAALQEEHFCYDSSTG
ncbi:hypothetical protein D9C73_015719 [Collichthys lucidus]|uniref:Uncharacterized protein n=1 Tax=Collichthys lucidus TaxID=240159 RepID=A0A4U5V1L9_COLLU|nr:hypothetical protein D9C73_015719 [Collichthys lucidus]